MKKIKIMLVSGSPRKGNSEAVLKVLKKYLEKLGTDVNLLLLREKNINRCNGCVEFCNKNLHCKNDNNDDMGEILKMMKETHGFVFATPTYFSMPPGLFKDFIDRSSILFTAGVDLSNKVASVIAVGTDLDNVGVNAQNLMTYCHVHSMIVLDSLCLIGKSNLYNDYENILKSNVNGDLKGKLQKLAARIYKSAKNLNNNAHICGN